MGQRPGAAESECLRAGALAQMQEIQHYASAYMSLCITQRYMSCGGEHPQNLEMDLRWAACGARGARGGVEAGSMPQHKAAT